MIIGICGEMGAGKTTLAKMIVENHCYAKLSFAGRFKRAMCELFNWNIRYMEEYEYKNDIDPVTGIIRRKLMQDFATGYIREQVDPLFHTKMAALDTRELLLRQTLVVYDDVRHTDEDDFIHKIGGIIIRVDRPDNPYEQSTHKSEGVKLNYDFTVLNDGDPILMYGRMRMLPVTDEEITKVIHKTYPLLRKYIDEWWNYD